MQKGLFNVQLHCKDRVYNLSFHSRHRMDVSDLRSQTSTSKGTLMSDERIIKGPILNNMVASLPILPILVSHTCLNLVKYDKIDKKMNFSEKNLPMISDNLTAGVISRLKEREKVISEMKKFGGETKGKAEKNYAFLRELL